MQYSDKSGQCVSSRLKHYTHPIVTIEQEEPCPLLNASSHVVNVTFNVETNDTTWQYLDFDLETQ